MYRGRTQSLCLISGGLDSLLAASLLCDQGIDVQCVVFTSPLWDPAPARAAAQWLQAELAEVDFTARLYQVFERCPKLDDVSANLELDCHAEMLKAAVELLDEYDCRFVATGEVLNEMGASQSEAGLASAAAYTGCPSLILRPLSARRLPASEPERKGWVDRDGLGDLEGDRWDRRQDLAARFGIAADAFGRRGPDPLADPEFVARLHDLRGHEGLGGKRSLGLLVVGRHFRLGPVTKLIMGRTDAENKLLEATTELYDLVLKAEAAKGPVGLLPFLATDDQIKQAAALCARFAGTSGTTTVTVRSPRGTTRVRVEPASQAAAELVEIQSRPWPAEAGEAKG